MPAKHRAPARTLSLRPADLLIASPMQLLTAIGVVLTLALTLFTGMVAGGALPKAGAMISTTKGDRAVSLARSRQGDPYRYGATGPHRFDCSGLTRWVFARLGKSLPHSSARQAGHVRHIARYNRRPGDLVFFTSGGHIYHVAIYAGRGYIWHAPYSGARVRREHLWTSHVWYGRVR